MKDGLAAAFQVCLCVLTPSLSLLRVHRIELVLCLRAVFRHARRCTCSNVMPECRKCT